MSALPRIRNAKNQKALRRIRWGSTRLHPLVMIGLVLAPIMFLVRGLRFIPSIHSAEGLPKSFKLGHPDAEDRLWELARALPEDCRFYVYGTPALVHPQSGVILAFVDGTPYYLRLPHEVKTITLEAGAPTETMEELEPEWVIGTCHQNESEWLEKAYAIYGSSARRAAEAV